MSRVRAEEEHEEQLRLSRKTQWRSRKQHGRESAAGESKRRGRNGFLTWQLGPIHCSRGWESDEVDVVGNKEESQKRSKHCHALALYLFSATAPSPCFGLSVHNGEIQNGLKVLMTPVLFDSGLCYCRCCAPRVRIKISRSELRASRCSSQLRAQGPYIPYIQP
jgi:hypothetical protein